MSTSKWLLLRQWRTEVERENLTSHQQNGRVTRNKGNEWSIRGSDKATLFQMPSAPPGSEGRAPLKPPSRLLAFLYYISFFCFFFPLFLMNQNWNEEVARQENRYHSALDLHYLRNQKSNLYQVNGIKTNQFWHCSQYWGGLIGRIHRKHKKCVRNHYVIFTYLWLTLCTNSNAQQQKQRTVPLWRSPQCAVLSLNIPVVCVIKCFLEEL